MRWESIGETPSSIARALSVVGERWTLLILREAYRGIDEAFAAYPHAIHYALKANSTLAIVRLLRSIGSKLEANAGGESQVA